MIRNIICVVALAALGALTGAARASAKVDFTDEQFEKVATKVLLNQVKVNTRLNPQIYDKGSEYYTEKFRLMPGRILLCDIKGEPSAYIYMGYFGEGKTPTVEDVVAKSVSYHDELWGYLSKMSYDPQGYKRFFESTFPEYIYTSSIILGVNAADAAYFESRSEIPHIIQNQKGAEDLAKGYFNSDDITLVRYIWGLNSEINGYEFSNGQNRIIVPFDIHTRRLFIDRIYTREEIDRDIDSYILDVDPREGEGYQKFMAVELESAENSRVYSDEDVFLPGGKITTPPAAAEMKSDPANYYLDPEEIRPIVRDSIETTIMLNSGRENSFFSTVEELDVRLIPGQLPLYTIDGHVAAYLYIAYAVPGPLPTFNDIISGAVESYEARENFRNSANRSNSRQFYMETFPYFLTCGFEIVGVNERWPSGLGSIQLPRFIMNQGKGEEAARRYFGTADFTLVRYIYCSKLNGYEYTDGNVNIIVPFDKFGEVYAENVMPRAYVDAHIDEYTWTPDAAKLESWFGMWQRELADGL